MKCEIEGCEREIASPIRYKGKNHCRQCYEERLALESYGG